MRKIYNPKMVRMMNQIHRVKKHLILMWVPGEAVIQGNEKADHYVKAALQGRTNWKNMIRQKQERIRQPEWTSSDNPMVTIKPKIKKKTGHRHSREETRL
jgi:ribonuclease HI